MPRKIYKSLLGLFVFGFILLNLAAFMHARRMIRFGSDSPLTARAGELVGFEKVKVLVGGVSVPKPLDHTDPAAQGLAFEEISLESEDGCSLAAWHVPHPDPRGVVLLAHGYAACKSVMVEEAAFLHEQGCALLLIDQRGNGASCDSVCSIGYHEGQDVKAGCDWLAARWPGQPLLAYGQSMGSVSILSAVHHFGLEPDGIALESPFPEFRGTVRNRFRLMKLPRTGLSELLCFWGGVQTGMNPFAHNPETYGSSVTCPSLVMIGAKDLYVFPHEAKRVHQAIPNSQYEVFHQSGHVSYLDREPEKYAQVVGDWLDEVLTGR